MSAASVCCIVFEFSTVQFSNKTIQKLSNVYCSSLTVMIFVFSTISMVLNVCNSTTIYVRLMYLLLDMVSIVIVTYYRVKFVVDKLTVNNIVNNLNHAAKFLDSLGVKVQNAKDKVVCRLLCTSFWRSRFVCGTYFHFRPA